MRQENEFHIAQLAENRAIIIHIVAANLKRRILEMGHYGTVNYLRLTPIIDVYCEDLNFGSCYHFF